VRRKPHGQGWRQESKNREASRAAAGQGLTLAPLGVVLDHLVDERDIGVAFALGLAHEIGIASLVGPEEEDVEHGWVSAGRSK